MDTGTKISGLAHVGLITWVMVGGLFSGSEEPTQVQVSEVSIITSEEFAALSRPPEATAIDPPEPAEPEPEPQPEPEPTEPEPEPEPEPAPAEPEVIDAPAEPEPEAPSEPVIPEPAPAPRPADRVAPEPAPAPPEDAAPAETEQEAVTPEPAESPDDVVEEPQEAEAPEAATTEIITEATETDEDGATTAPMSSPRPQSRPERPAPVETAEAAPEPAPEPEPEPEPQPTPEPDREAVDRALAAALGEQDTPGVTSPQPDAPAGPPLTDGERDALRLSVQRCWNVGALSTEAMGVTVTVAFSMNPDATPEAGSLRMAGATGGSDAAAQQAYDAARRAILRCGADGFDLPREKYEQWRDIEMVFNPESMRIR